MKLVLNKRFFLDLELDFINSLTRGISLTIVDFVDYFVVNVSSPNTPNLRDLQEKEPLTKILAELQLLNLKMKNQWSLFPHKYSAKMSISFTWIGHFRISIVQKCP